MSWINTVRVESPCQPRLLLAVIKNRAAGSTTEQNGINDGARKGVRDGN